MAGAGRWPEAPQEALCTPLHYYLFLYTVLLFPVQDALEELAPLSAEQQHIADRVVAGHSIFFTGCAGAVSTVLYICRHDTLWVQQSQLGFQAYHVSIPSHDAAAAFVKMSTMQKVDGMLTCFPSLSVKAECDFCRHRKVSAAQAHPTSTAPGDHLCDCIHRPRSLFAGRHHPQRLCRYSTVLSPVCSIWLCVSPKTCSVVFCNMRHHPHCLCSFQPASRDCLRKWKSRPRRTCRLGPQAVLGERNVPDSALRCRYWEGE